MKNDVSVARRLALFEGAEQVLGIGSWEWVPETGELNWSDNVFRLIGLEPGSEQPSLELFRERTHPDDRERQARHVERVVGGSMLNRAENRLVLPGGEVRHLRSTVTTVEETESRPRRLLGIVQDVTDLVRAEAEIRAQLAVAETLAEWEGLETSGERLLQCLAEALGCAAAALWIGDEENLTVRTSWNSASIDLSGSVGIRLFEEIGEEIARRAWSSGKPVWSSTGAEFGLCCTTGFPAMNRSEIVAAITLHSADRAEMSERLTASLTGIGHELGQFLAHRRGELAPSPLTAREREVLQLAAQDHSGPEIAKRLLVSPATVKTHFSHIYEKLGVTERAAAVAKALREGLID
jgi:PAS domain S-box-containing protein